jgi:hypothetical protein
VSGSYPARRTPAGLAADRRLTRAVAQADERAILELHALDNESLIGRAKVHALGSVARQAVYEVLDLGWEVQAAAERNPFGAQLAASVARGAAREFDGLIERTAWRLG